MKITTQDCKEAIVQFVINNPTYVSKLFIPLEDEEPAKKTSNWKRISKTIGSYNGKFAYVRQFDCDPFDDQLRATVWSDNEQILNVEIYGE